MVSTKLCILAVLLLAIAIMAAELRRNSKLFKSFPLHEHLETLYSAHEQKIDNFHALQSAIQEAHHREEQHNIEQLTKVLENVKLSEQKNEKPQTEAQKSIFHNYDAEAIAIYGSADLEFLKDLLKHENYRPIFLEGKAKGMVTLWVINHKDTSLGSYKQLMITITVTSNQLEYNLGVTYDGENGATFLFPAFGKLSNHARLFVLKSLYDREVNKKFGQLVNGLSSELVSAKIEKTQEADASFVNFLFTDSQGKLIIGGKVEEDNSWSSYVKAGWKIFKALGLSGVLDLWNLPYVTMKTVGTSLAPNGFLTHTVSKFNQLHTDFKQSIHELNNYELKFGDTGIGKQLKDMKFKPAFVVRMPLFQYAMTTPKDQKEDNEHRDQGDLRFVDPDAAKEVIQKAKTN